MQPPRPLPEKVRPDPIQPGLLLRAGSESHEDAQKFNPLVAPTDNWNDFGYSIAATVGLRTKTTVEWFSAKFAIKDFSNLKHFVQDGHKASSPASSLARIKYPFACLLTEVRSYVAIGRMFGADRARALLASINDISLIRKENGQVPGWPTFFDDPVFQKAMIRSSEAYEAYKHGARVLEAGEDVVSDACQSFSIHVAGKTGPKLELDFPFKRSNQLRGRIAVLIGANGCGKTSTLASLARALFDRDTKEAIFEKRPDVNQVLVFAHPISLRTFGRRRGQGSAAVKLFALEPKSKRGKDPDAANALVDLARSRYQDGDAVDLLESAIRAEFGGLKAYVPVQEDGVEIDRLPGQWRPLSAWLAGGEERQLEAITKLDRTREVVYVDQNGKPRSLSLGQAVFAQFATRALAFAGPGSIFVIDEPENYLHPNLVSQFMRLLSKVLTTTRSIAIVATHSPFVVREVSSALVQVIRKTEDQIEVSKPRLQTLGSNVSSISSEIFDDAIPTHLYEELVEAAELNLLGFEEVLERYRDDLSVEAMMMVRQKEAVAKK